MSESSNEGRDVWRCQRGCFHAYLSIEGNMQWKKQLLKKEEEML